MTPLPVNTRELPGSERSRQFVGEDHGAGLSFFFVDGEPRWGPKLHRHPYEEIFVVGEGKATFTIDGEEIEAGTGDIVVAPAGKAHRFRNSGSDQLRLTAIHASPRFETEWLE